MINRNRLILKPQQRLRREKQNIFTKEVNKYALSASNDRRIQYIDSIENMHMKKHRGIYPMISFIEMIIDIIYSDIV